MTCTTTPAPRALTLAAWRDYDEDACTLPGMSLGELDLAGPPEEHAARLWECGVRRARLAEDIDLTSVDDPDAAAHAVRRLCLVRDLTARAVLVQWQLRLPAEPDDGLARPQPSPAAPDPHRPRRPGGRAHPVAQRALSLQVPVAPRPRFRPDPRPTVGQPAPLHRGRARIPRGHRPAGLRRPAVGRTRGHRRRLPGGTPGLPHRTLLWWLPYRVNRWIQEAMAI